MNTAQVAAAVCVAILSFGAHAEVSKKDQEFFTKAGGGGLYEVEAGKLAQQKGGSEAVKSYGAMLVKDHGAANEELKALAKAKGAVLPEAVPADKQKRLEKIASAKDFDKEFVKEVGIDDHKMDVALFENTIKRADDAEVRAFASKTLPTLKAHKEHAEGLKKAHKH